VPVSAASIAPASSAGWFANQRALWIAIGLAALLAMAVGIATFPSAMSPGQSGDSLASRVGRQVVDGVAAGAQTVASLFDLRSPGARAAGALASLKQKRQAALHERALPKTRRFAAPVGPLAAIVGASPVPPVAIVPPAVPPPGTPLYGVVGKPEVIPAAPPLGGGGGGGVVFPAAPSVGGGGGGIVVPPAVTTVPPTTTPGVPGTSAVPEPASWAMMLVGFAMIGRVLRRSRRPAGQSARR
jgi:hypothetical protein